MKSVPPPSSARLGRHQLWRPPRSSESFPHGLCLQATVTKLIRIHSPTNQEYKLVQWSKPKSSANSRIVFLLHSLPTFVFHCQDFSTRYLALHKLLQNLLSSNGIATIIKTASWKCIFIQEGVPSGAIRNFERVRVLQSLRCTSCGQFSSPMPLPWTSRLSRKTIR